MLSVQTDPLPEICGNEAASIEAVRQWKYHPTLLNGAPVAVEMEVTVKFSMGS